MKEKKLGNGGKTKISKKNEKPGKKSHPRDVIYYEEETNREPGIKKEGENMPFRKSCNYRSRNGKIIHRCGGLVKARRRK